VGYVQPKTRTINPDFFPHSDDSMSPLIHPPGLVCVGWGDDGISEFKADLP